MSQPTESESLSSLARLASPSSAPSQKLSVNEFYALQRRQTLGVDTVVELVNGEMCQLPTDERLDRQIQLLQLQIQQHLAATRGCGDWVVRSRQPLKIDEYCELKPALCIVNSSVTKTSAMRNSITKNSAEDESTVQDGREGPFHERPLYEHPLWVMDVTQEGLNWLETGRSQLLATAKIPEYWSLTVSQAELRTYQDPTKAGFQSCRLLHVGESVAPSLIPQLTLRLQEPVPLHFLTRTLGGQRSYETANLPLQLVCSPDDL